VNETEKKGSKKMKGFVVLLGLVVSIVLSGARIIHADSVNRTEPCFTNEEGFQKNKKCALNWTFKGKSYMGCTAKFTDVKPFMGSLDPTPTTETWCATVSKYNVKGNKKQWGACDCIVKEGALCYNLLCLTELG
jgi:hypothetical protein